MPSFLKVQGYVFETEALKDAYFAVPPAKREATTGYDEEALRTLIRYFADWGPSRDSDLRVDPEESLDQLSADKKRALYNDCVKQLTKNLTEQYSRDVDQEDFEGFLLRMSHSELPDSILTFFLQYLWNFSKDIHTYEQDLLGTTAESKTEPQQEEARSDSNQFTAAIHRLPSEYLDEKHEQYEDEGKINGIRFQALNTIRTTGGLSLGQLQDYIEQETTNHDTDIMRAYDEFTVLGQLYYDYYKPRLDFYLTAVTDHLIDRLNVTDSTAHHVNFIEPRNRLGDVTWFAIYPTGDDKATAYQLFLGIHWDGVRYGLYIGDDLREEGWRENVDINKITETDGLTFETVAEKFDGVLEEYYRQNGIKIPEPNKPPSDITTTVARQLRNENQVVFYGPPGTGKTFEAKRFANWWVYEESGGSPRDEQVESVTFHPSFSYEDFIEGLTAEATETGDVEYRVEDGILKRVAARAQRAYENSDVSDTTDEAPPYVLIIDEINRGNLAQIFGETITLLENDKRGSYEVSLAHSDDSFTLPPNLYVIGTMNTADRSIALVDAALRRRFRFLQFQPDYEALWTHHEFEDRSAVVDATAGNDSYRVLLALSMLAIEQINERIVSAPELSKGQQIGHSYLWDIENVTDLVDAWQYDILPLLEEYYFGQFERIRRQLFDGTGNQLVDWDQERIKSFTDTELAAFLSSFVTVETDIDYTSVQATEAEQPSSSTQYESPTFPEFNQIVGEKIYDRIGSILQGDSLDDIHKNDHFERISLTLVSNHPDHPDEDVRYRFNPTPHGPRGDRPKISADLTVPDIVHEEIGEEIKQHLQSDQLQKEWSYVGNKYPTATREWVLKSFSGDPYSLDGRELIEAMGEDVVEEAINEFCSFVETFHPFFIEQDIPSTEQ